MASQACNVVFVAPFFLDTTVRFIRAVVELPGARVGLVSQDAEEKLDPAVRARLAAHYRIDDGLNPDQIAAATRWMAGRLGSVDRLVGALEQLQVPLGLVRDMLGLDGMRAEEARNFREKSRMKDVLGAAGIQVARHRLVSSVAEGVEFSRSLGTPVVIKPPDGAGGFSTFRAANTAEVALVLERQRPTAARPSLIEEFMTGLERSFDAVTIRGKPVWHSLTVYTPTPLEVLENPWIQWTVLLPRETDHPRWDEVRRVGVATLRALGMTTGLSHMEWFERPNGSVAVSEIGARPPGARIVPLIGYAHDCDFFHKWARLVVFEEFDPPETKYAAGAAYLRGQGKGRVKAIHGLDQAKRELGHLVVDAQLPKLGAAASASYEGEGTVILRHPETHVVEEGLKRLVSLVRVELG